MVSTAMPSGAADLTASLDLEDALNPACIDVYAPVMVPNPAFSSLFGERAAVISKPNVATTPKA